MFTRLAIPDVILIQPRRHSDERGWFAETWKAEAWSAGGVAGPFVQDNESLSRAAGTVRGLHFQLPPMAQGKLVRCTAGAVFDVAVDIRRNSATFGQHVAVELNSSSGQQLYVPEGFAHGYCTISPDSVVEYKVTRPHDPTSEGGILWKDPDLAIDWPLLGRAAIIAPRDQKLPLLRDLRAIF